MEVAIRRFQSSGAATWWFRNASNSGRGAKIDCTIVFFTRKARTGAGGSIGCRRSVGGQPSTFSVRGVMEWWSDGGRERINETSAAVGG